MTQLGVITYNDEVGVTTTHAVVTKTHKRFIMTHVGVIMTHVGVNDPIRC